MTSVSRISSSQISKWPF